MKNKIKIEIPVKPVLKLLANYINRDWYAPQDCLQRGLEANIWQSLEFNSPVLEIGIGDGQASKFIFSTQRKIDVGIDINPVGLKQALETGIYKKTLQADVTKLPFKKSAFNSIISNSTFEHIVDDKKAVKEISRVLKKSGLFFITVPTSNFGKMIKQIEKKQRDINKVEKKINIRLSHFNYRSLSQWDKIFLENNLQIAYYRYYFPYETFKLWYKLFKFSTTKFRNREIWSYFLHSRFSFLFPKKIYKFFLYFIMRSSFENGFRVKNDYGAQIFMIAQKK